VLSVGLMFPYMKRLHVFIPEQQIEGLAVLTKKTGLKASELIRRALDEYLMKSQLIEQQRRKNRTNEGDNNYAREMID
jgi:Arc/MetJ-type ribon-helix-helix transcriptional regulator